MLSKRIIACLDVRDGRVVKGVGFRDHVDSGDVVELARRYVDQGADELVFYDISASADGRPLDRTWIHRIAPFLNIPFCVAGGIGSVSEAEAVLNAGADKISVNTPALRRPDLIDELSAAFGTQCVVVGMDSLWSVDDWWVWESTGRVETMKHAARRTADWMREVQERGAGEIVLNCMAQDGGKRGYDLEQIAALRSLCKVPLIGSGGAGSVEDFARVFREGQVDGALAAGVFHRGELTIGDVKSYLSKEGIPVRVKGNEI